MHLVGRRLEEEAEEAVQLPVDERLVVQVERSRASRCEVLDRRLPLRGVELVVDPEHRGDRIDDVGGIGQIGRDQVGRSANNQLGRLGFASMDCCRRGADLSSQLLSER